MKKRFKSKKRKSKKFLIYIFLLLLLLYFKPFNLKFKLKNSNVRLINEILDSMTYNYNLSNKKLYNSIKKNYKNLFNSPKFILNSQLMYKPSKSKIEVQEKPFKYSENDAPLIYIYNSHQGEKYSNKYFEDYNIVPSVITASYMLKEKLDNIGINTIVEENDILSYMKQNNYDHSKSYIASRYFLEQIINKYDSIKLYIDLHRDSVSHDATTVNIDGKDYAKLMFVIGLKYETYEQNLSIVQYLNNKLNENYSGISRGILKKNNVGANGIYNQDLNSNVILIELGGIDNNIDEINNTLDILSKVIGEYINEKE